MVADMLLAEIFGIFMAKHLIQVLAGISELFATREMKREVGQIDNSLQPVHLIGIHVLYYIVTHKENTGVRMVHDVMNLIGIKLMKDRDNHGTIGERSQECYCPMSTIAPANGHFIAFADSAVLKKDMQLFYFACHVVVL